jgi:hypothetical protein
MSHHLDTQLAAQTGQLFIDDLYVFPGEGSTVFVMDVNSNVNGLHSEPGFHPAVYQIARGPQYYQAFHDITTGDNTAEFPPKTIAGYRAAPGWDPVTGWGSPDAQVLVPLLARHADA